MRLKRRIERLEKDSPPEEPPAVMVYCQDECRDEAIARHVAEHDVEPEIIICLHRDRPMAASELQQGTKGG